MEGEKSMTHIRKKQTGSFKKAALKCVVMVSMVFFLPSPLYSQDAVRDLVVKIHLRAALLISSGHGLGASPA